MRTYIKTLYYPHLVPVTLRPAFFRFQYRHCLGRCPLEVFFWRFWISGELKERRVDPWKIGPEIHLPLIRENMHKEVCQVILPITWKSIFYAIAIKSSPCFKNFFKGLWKRAFWVKSHKTLDLFTISEKYQGGDTPDAQHRCHMAVFIDIHLRN